MDSAVVQRGARGWTLALALAFRTKGAKFGAESGPTMWGFKFISTTSVWNGVWGFL